MTKHKCCNPQDNNKKFLKSIRKDALKNFIDLVATVDSLESNIDKDRNDLSLAEQNVRTWTRLIGNDIGDSVCTEDSDYHNAKNEHQWELVWEYTCPEKCSKSQYAESTKARLWSECCNDAKRLSNYTIRCRNKTSLRGADYKRGRDYRYCNKRILFARSQYSAQEYEMPEEERYKW